MSDSQQPKSQARLFEVQHAVTTGDARGWWTWRFDDGKGQQSFPFDDAVDKATELRRKHPGTQFRVVGFGTGPQDFFSLPLTGDAPEQPK